MTNFTQTFILLSVILLACSCLKQTESITPIAPVRTMAQLQREAMMNTAIKAAGNNGLSRDAMASLETNQNDQGLFYLNLKYNLVNLDVYDNAQIPNSFEQIGNSLLKTFAKIFLKLTGERTVEIGDLDLDLSGLNLDFQIVKSLEVKRIFVQYNKDFDESVDNQASFSFIKSLDISKALGTSPHLFSYKKANNNCKYKCLDFSIIDGNIFELVKSSKIIRLRPALKIASIPEVTELKIDGQIEMRIGLKLPF